jgi:hypothetical protein
MSNTPPIVPKDWQNQYPEKQAHRDSLAKAGQLIIPIVIGIIPPILFLIIYTAHLMENVPTTEIAIRHGAQGATLIIAIIIFTIFSIKYLFKTAAEFLEKFHNLPVGNESSRGHAKRWKT